MCRQVDLRLNQWLLVVIVPEHVQIPPIHGFGYMEDLLL